MDVPKSGKSFFISYRTKTDSELKNFIYKIEKIGIKLIINFSVNRSNKRIKHYCSLKLVQGSGTYDAMVTD